MSDIPRPETFDGCKAGDEIFVEAIPDTARRVYRRDDSGTFSDITSVTDGVEPIEGGFRIGGQKKKPGVYSSTDRWSADVVADRESSETHRRGVVR